MSWAGSAWANLPASAQDTLTIALALSPLAVLGVTFLVGHRPMPLVRALLRRHWGVSATFLSLIAICVAGSVALLSTERGLRTASAQATDPFDVVVSAPGSETTALLASIFLRPADMGLLDGETLAAILDDPRVALAAPLAFGDSVDGAPIVGTVEALPRHLTDAIEGRLWNAPFEAVVGADLPYALGTELDAAHGHGDAAGPGVHGIPFTVVGRLGRTGTPFDDAVLVPLEGVWLLHSLGDGHPPPEAGRRAQSMLAGSGVRLTTSERGRLGPPYHPDYMPGVPAVLVRATGIGEAYSLRAAYQRDGETMAILPGAELARLHGLLGDVREALSLTALLSLGLVAAAVLCGLVIVARLFRRQIALLAALGAPRRFTMGVLWLHAAAHLVPGALLGLVLGWLAGAPAAALVSSRTGLNVSPAPGVEEAMIVAVFAGLGALAAVIVAPLNAVGQPARTLR